MTKELAITELLVKLYRTPEVFIAFLKSLNDGNILVSNIPLTGSMRTIVFNAVDEIRRRGLIDTNFFERLQKDSPQSQEISEVSAMWLIDSASWSKPPNQETKKEATKAPVVFVSYSRKDAAFYEELETHLKLLELKGLISIWQEGRVEAGEEWDQIIKSQFEKADIIILLVSNDFLASKLLHSKELLSALEKPDKEKRIIPVIVRACDWQATPLNSVQVLPLDAKPIAQSNDPDRQWLDLSQSIKRLVLNWRASS